MPRLKRKNGNNKRKPKWAKLSTIDRRTHVGTAAWRKRHTPKQQRLSAWRNMHRVGTHASVRRVARSMGKKPSSRMTTRQMIRGVRFI